MLTVVRIRTIPLLMTVRACPREENNRREVNHLLTERAHTPESFIGCVPPLITGGTFPGLLHLIDAVQVMVVFHVRPQGIEPCSKQDISLSPTTSEIRRVRDLRIELSASTLSE
jgi:hypothetical protein